jgi:hypothetical protein
VSGERFDVLVVGSGPAGSIAALVLARGGARVALVDKASFPSDKACGDLIGPRGVRLLSDLGVEIPEATRVDDMVVVGPTGRRAPAVLRRGQLPGPCARRAARSFRRDAPRRGGGASGAARWHASSCATATRSSRWLPPNATATTPSSTSRQWRTWPAWPTSTDPDPHQETERGNTYLVPGRPHHLPLRRGRSRPWPRRLLGPLRRFLHSLLGGGLLRRKPLGGRCLRHGLLRHGLLGDGLLRGGSLENHGPGVSRLRKRHGRMRVRTTRRA